MIVKRVSLLSGIEREMDLNVTQEQLDRVAGRERIQNVLPHLSASEREFIISGISAEEWDAEFGDED